MKALRHEKDGESLPRITRIFANGIVARRRLAFDRTHTRGIEVPPRDILVRRLCEAWKKCIECAYPRRRINSERSLQAAYWAQLNELLPDTRTIYIEPVVRADNCSIIPDMLICNSKEVIGVVELKYTPRGNARIKKDLLSLCELAKQSGSLSVVNQRYRGAHSKAKEFYFSSHVVFAWGGIHKDKSPELGFNEFAKKCGGVASHSLLQMHAITDAREDPKVLCRRT